MQKISMKIWASMAVASAALITSATPAAAQTTTVATGNNFGQTFTIPSSYGGGFMSYYADGMRHNGNTLITDLRYLRRTTTKLGRIFARWNGDSNTDDYVTGLGWGASSANLTRSITYNVRKYNPRRTNTSATVGVSTMGVYGWLCPTGNEEMVEYYIVDSWLGRGNFIPFDGSFRKTASINGQNYRFYSTGTVTRGNGCGADDATFRQLWAVRTSKKTRGTRTIKMRDFFDAWDNVSRVDTSAPAGYQIVSLEGFGGTTGTFDVEVNK